MYTLEYAASDASQASWTEYALYSGPIEVVNGRCTVADYNEVLTLCAPHNGYRLVEDTPIEAVAEVIPTAPSKARKA